MKVENVSISKIKPYERNPRRNDAAVEAVAASIQEFGFQQPIVCDMDGVIIVGHTRLKAAKKLGLKTVPVVYADLQEDKAKAYRLADNKTGELAEWDFDLLDLELGDIELDMEPFGFDDEPRRHEWFDPARKKTVQTAKKETKNTTSFWTSLIRKKPPTIAIHPKWFIMPLRNGWRLNMA